MKILCCGDWHLTIRKPRNRLDNYPKTIENKINQIGEICEKHEIDLILEPGDLTDHWEFPDKFKTRWIGILKRLPHIVAVAGQHDMRYHTSDINNTPLGVLRKAVDFSLIGKGSFSTIPLIIDSICLYGAGWQEDIPKIHSPDKFNILITHRMITMDKLWAQQEDYEVPGTFLRKHKFDLIVSGDNHNSFHYYDNNRWLINCGSLMRNKIDQEHHKPCVWVFDTETRLAEEILLQINPFGDVFNLLQAGLQKTKNLRLADLAESLKKKSRIKGLNYKARVAKRVEELGKDINPKTKDFIEEIMADDRTK